MTPTDPRLSWWMLESPSTALQNRVQEIVSAPGVERVAVMPDVHESAWVPNGLVVATRGLLYPRLVGSDIGCGVAAIRFQARANALGREDWSILLSKIAKAVPLTKSHPHAVAPELPGACPAADLSHSSLVAAALREGRYQLGTLGGGNHFLEFQKDDEGALWVMVHSGSRAMGQRITDFHLARAQRSGSPGLESLDLEHSEGKAYLADVQWAMTYARENRLAMINRAADLLENRFGIGLDEPTYLDCPHNFVRREWHLGQSLLVHRKSANGAFAGELGWIPGSMGTESRLVRGLGHAESLCSSAHGAGRRLSRTQARQSVAMGDLRQVMRGIVIDESKLGALCEESPKAYKDLGKVMEAQNDLVKTVRVLRPICVHKGG